MKSLTPSAPFFVPADPACAATPEGTGPRHLAFSPDNRSVYAISEISTAVLAFRREPASGALELRQECSALPPELEGGGGCADLHVHPSGRFLYASNQGNSAITVFGIEQESGELTYRGHFNSGGDCPRGFLLMPDGEHLLAANQESRNVVLFRLDGETGLAERTGIAAETQGKPIALGLFPAR